MFVHMVTTTGAIFIAMITSQTRPINASVTMTTTVDDVSSHNATAQENDVRTEMIDNRKLVTSAWWPTTIETTNGDVTFAGSEGVFSSDVSGEIIATNPNRISITSSSVVRTMTSEILNANCCSYTSVATKNSQQDQPLHPINSVSSISSTSLLFLRRLRDSPSRHKHYIISSSSSAVNQSSLLGGVSRTGRSLLHGCLLLVVASLLTPAGCLLVGFARIRAKRKLEERMRLEKAAAYERLGSVSSAVDAASVASCAAFGRGDDAEPVGYHISSMSASAEYLATIYCDGKCHIDDDSNSVVDDVTIF